MRIVSSLSPVVLGGLLLVGACATPNADPDAGSLETTGDGDGDGTGDGDGEPGDGDSGDGDGDPTGGSCQLWIPEDCADPKLKCMPWSEQPDGVADTTRCCSLDATAVSLGERCEVIDYDGSCLDNCPLGTMCVVDASTDLEGYCQVFCDSSNPDSCVPEEVCKPFFEMLTGAQIVPLCMSRCDPLLQDCQSKGRPGWTCLPEGALSPSFLCMPPAESPKAEYEPCFLANSCAIGLACVPASEVLGCTGLFSCCTRYCDLSDPESGCTMGNECVDLESDVPGLENVGICATPF